MIQSISAHATIFFFFFLTILETDIKKKKNLQRCRTSIQKYHTWGVARGKEKSHSFQLSIIGLFWSFNSCGGCASEQKCHIHEWHLAIKSLIMKSQKYNSIVLPKDTYCQCDSEMSVVLQGLKRAEWNKHVLKKFYGGI